MYNSHIVNHIKNPGVKDGRNTLHVVGVCSNPVRYHSRLRLARDWIQHIAKTPNVHLTVVEASYGARKHELIDDCPYDNIDILPITTNSEAWIKESMINIGFRHITAKFRHARYFAWVDMDVHFRQCNWAQETIQKLQHFEIIQPWSDSLDMGPLGGVLQHCRSFGHQQQHGEMIHPHANKEKTAYYQYAHPGYAWACTRKFLERVSGSGGSSGPLIDWAILGSGDYHMSWACLGKVALTVPKQYQPSYLRKCLEWQKKAADVCFGEVGYIHGTIEHQFHGGKKKRYYNERYKLLVKNKFDPDIHIIHDEQGLATLVGNRKLEHAIHKYNVSRQEDSCDE